MSSKGKWEAASGWLEGDGGGSRTALPAILASSMTCCDTWAWTVHSAHKIHLLYSGLSAHGSPHTPTPDIQLGGCGEVGRLQLQKCSSLPLTHDGKSPVVPHLSVGPYLLLNLLPRGHNVTLILTTVGLHHIYSVPCCQTGLCWSIPSVGSCCLQCVAQWVPWSQWLKCNKFMICSVHWDRRLITFHSVSPCFHFCSFISSVLMVIIVNSLI